MLHGQPHECHGELPVIPSLKINRAVPRRVIDCETFPGLPQDELYVKLVFEVSGRAELSLDHSCCCEKDDLRILFRDFDVLWILDRQLRACHRARDHE